MGHVRAKTNQHVKYESSVTYCSQDNERKTLLKPMLHVSEWRSYSVLKNCRSPRCALCKSQQRCGNVVENAVQSPRTPCGGVYFE